MTQTYVLELMFKDSYQTARKIEIKRPKRDISAETALSVLDAITNSGVFQNQFGDNRFAQALGARYVTRTVQDVYMVK